MAQFREKFSGAVWLSNLDPITEVRSDLHSIKYFKSADYGRVLIIDDELQHVEAWAPFYHEIIVHLPCYFINKPVDALILGGGSLFAAEELLKYRSIQKIDLVDHDIEVVRSTVAAYPEREFIVKDRRLEIIEQDFREFLPNCRDKYDIIINDCFDLYNIDRISDMDFYFDMERLLTRGGVCSDLVYRSIYWKKTAAAALQRIPKRLNSAVSMLALPEYPGIIHLLTMWGRNASLGQEPFGVDNKIQKRMHRAGKFKIYNPSFLKFYLYVPPYLNKYVR